MRPLLRPAAAALVVAAAGLVWTPSPAGAAACTSQSGVTVVVDFKQLGGGIDQACVSDQGQADDLFVAAGHALENVQGQAFVCRVDGLPSADDESCARTPPANKYWGLWWSDGTDGAWTYSSQGAYSLDVPDGGAVAFAWNNTSTAAKPGVAPPDHDGSTSSPEPNNPKPGGNGGGGGGGQGGGTSSGDSTGTPSTAPAESPSADGDRERSRDGDDTKAGDAKKNEKKDRDGTSKKRDRDADPTEEPSATSSADADQAPVAAEPPADAGSDGLPVWVGPSAAGGALAIAGLAAYLRRRAA
ncbi:hypothetical protein [Nocardioides aestuarii]|uniref:DUF4430 domain-containing protein n=1 Tax=Nocardioides aestuarii TaxID=252231 RepID=A0ABW4TI58_9ACTN